MFFLLKLLIFFKKYHLNDFSFFSFSFTFKLLTSFSDERFQLLVSFSFSLSFFLRVLSLQCVACRFQLCSLQFVFRFSLQKKFPVFTFEFLVFMGVVGSGGWVG